MERGRPLKDDASNRREHSPRECLFFMRLEKRRDECKCCLASFLCCPSGNNNKMWSQRKTCFKQKRTKEREPIGLRREVFESLSLYFSLSFYSKKIIIMFAAKWSSPSPFFTISNPSPFFASRPLFPNRYNALFIEKRLLYCISTLYNY